MHSFVKFSPYVRRARIAYQILHFLLMEATRLYFAERVHPTDGEDMELDPCTQAHI